MRATVALILVSLAMTANVLAGAPDLVAHYAELAGPGFVPSAERGRAFFLDTGGADEKMPNCASCHGSDPTQAGQHAFTGKTVKPLAPAANASRFVDLAKVEKWFRRNCKDVLDRECTPAEKADFILFLEEVKQ